MHSHGPVHKLSVSPLTHRADTDEDQIKPEEEAEDTGKADAGEEGVGNCRHDWT